MAVMQLVRVERPGPGLEEARALLVEHRSMGFGEAAPYLADPTPGALCLELLLR